MKDINKRRNFILSIIANFRLGSNHKAPTGLQQDFHNINSKSKKKEGGLGAKLTKNAQISF